MLYMHYAKTRPGQPDPGTGRVYAYGQAGKNFYLNAGEHRLVEMRGATASLWIRR